jgi:hypothetical protein
MLTHRRLLTPSTKIVANSAPPACVSAHLSSTQVHGVRHAPLCGVCVRDPTRPGRRPPPRQLALTICRTGLLRTSDVKEPSLLPQTLVSVAGTRTSPRRPCVEVEAGGRQQSGQLRAEPPSALGCGESLPGRRGNANRLLPERTRARHPLGNTGTGGRSGLLGRTEHLPGHGCAAAGSGTCRSTGR